MKRTAIRSLLAAIAASSLVGCLLESQVTPPPTKEAGGSDEIDTRLAVDRTGHPVSGARIALVKAGDSTGTALAISATGSDGSFPAFVVPDGFYSVVLRDPGDSLGRFVDSVHIVSRKLPSGRDTLLSLGSVRGVVKMATGDSPTSVDIALLGTDIVTAPKADGTFKIDLVPGGLYTLGAVTSLDGYGRLYKRIQVADGQNLVLPDTLVLPFTGLPVPAGLRVLQDTATGNVKVTWNRVVHPDLMGYVLERVESGTTTFSRYLTDSTWTDSLGAYWEAMPLYGPWPARDVAYRVRSRSLSGAIDTKSTALAITAKAPEWTKHVDSVKVTMTTDSVTGVSTLKWNTLVHPDAIGSRIVRTVGGTQDCSDTTTKSEWSDSKCADTRTEVMDSTGGTKNSVRLVREKGDTVKYSIQIRRRSGWQEPVANTWRKQEATTWIAWRDSTVPESDATARFQTFGGWILKRHVYNAKIVDAAISRDGVNWETIPDAMDFATGIGDSLWTGTLDSDGLHMTIRSRRTSQDWRVRTVNLPSKTLAIRQLTVLDGKLVVGINPASDQWSGDSIWVVTDDSTLLPGKIGGIGPDMSSMFSYEGVPVTQRLRVDAISGPMSGVVSVVDSGKVVSSKDLLWKSGNRSGLQGAVGMDGGAIVSYVSTGSSNQLSKFVYLPLSGNAILLSGEGAPAVSSQAYSGSGCVFRDEIWALVDGNLWKGKLNLPK